jgi:hypothetical protein
MCYIYIGIAIIRTSGHGTCPRQRLLHVQGRGPPAPLLAPPWRSKRFPLVLLPSTPTAPTLLPCFPHVRGDRLRPYRDLPSLPPRAAEQLALHPSAPHVHARCPSNCSRRLWQVRHIATCRASRSNFETFIWNTCNICPKQLKHL